MLLYDVKVVKMKNRIGQFRFHLVHWGIGIHGNAIDKVNNFEFLWLQKNQQLIQANYYFFSLSISSLHCIKDQKTRAPSKPSKWNMFRWDLIRRSLSGLKLLLNKWWKTRFQIYARSDFSKRSDNGNSSFWWRAWTIGHSKLNKWMNETVNLLTVTST